MRELTESLKKSLLPLKSAPGVQSGRPVVWGIFVNSILICQCIVSHHIMLPLHAMDAKRLRDLRPRIRLRRGRRVRRLPIMHIAEFPRLDLLLVGPEPSMKLARRTGSARRAPLACAVEWVNSNGDRELVASREVKGSYILSDGRVPGWSIRLRNAHFLLLEGRLPLGSSGGAVYDGSDGQLVGAVFGILRGENRTVVTCLR